MKHTIRQNRQLTQIDCELGSGILDKNGKEISDGDRIQWTYFNGDLFRTIKAQVLYTQGDFYVVDDEYSREEILSDFAPRNYDTLAEVADVPSRDLEIVGHVTD